MIHAHPIAIRRIETAHGTLEVISGGAPGGAIAIATAHPAEACGARTAELLGGASAAAVVCVNPRGLGASSPAPPIERGRPADDALAAMVDDIEDARRQMEAPPWVFWGMSGGGWLGQLYARRHPTALAGLILESTCPCFRTRLADPACLISPFHPSWRAALAAADLIDPTSHDAVGDARDTEWVDVDGVGAVFRRRNGPALLVSPMALSREMRRIMPALWSFDATPWLAELAVPTLVIGTTADPVVPLERSRALHEAIAGSSFAIIEGGGHVPVNDPRPEITGAVGQAVLAFLRDRIRG